MAKLIVLDPGHGDWDCGAVACDGRLEKSFNLELGLAVRDALAAYDCQVIMTRTADVALCAREPLGADLHARAAVANQAGADLFLSLHHDADDSPAARGASLYIWNKNGGWSPAVDCGTVNHTDPKSFPLAQIVTPVVRDTLKGLGIPWRGDIMCADFQVLRDTEGPAMLLECFFGTSPADVAIMRAPGAIQSLAAGVARAVAAALGMTEKVQAPAKPAPTVKLPNGTVLPATIPGDTMLGPVRAIIEGLGMSLAWDGTTQQATIEGYKPVAIRYQGQTVQGILVGDKTYAPVRATAAMFGRDVAWDQETHTVDIKDQPGAPSK